MFLDFVIAFKPFEFECCLVYAKIGLQLRWIKLSNNQLVLLKYNHKSACTVVLRSMQIMCDNNQSVEKNVVFYVAAILTAAMEMLGGKGAAAQCRKPEIMADAAYSIFLQDASYTGNFLVDEKILKDEGITDFDQYAVEPGV